MHIHLCSGLCTSGQLCQSLSDERCSRDRSEVLQDFRQIPRHRQPLLDTSRKQAAGRVPVRRTRRPQQGGRLDHEHGLSKPCRAECCQFEFRPDVSGTRELWAGAAGGKVHLDVIVIPAGQAVEAQGIDAAQHSGLPGVECRSPGILIGRECAREGGYDARGDASPAAPSDLRANVGPGDACSAELFAGQQTVLTLCVVDDLLVHVRSVRHDVRIVERLSTALVDGRVRRLTCPALATASNS